MAWRKSPSFLFVNLFITCSTLIIPRTCRHNWIPWEDSCFMLSEDKETWTNAQLHCMALNGYLAEITDREMNTFLKDHLKSRNSHDHSTDYFIGLTDEAKANAWEWPHSRTFPKFTDWNVGQPENNSQHCTIMKAGSGYKWHDDYCSLLHNFICQETI